MEQIENSSKNKNNWWLIHISLLFVWLYIFGVWTLATTAISFTGASDVAQKYLDIIRATFYLLFYPLLLYPLAVIFSAFRYKKTGSYKGTKVITIIMASILFIATLVMMLSYFKMQNANKEYSQNAITEIITADDPINDFICPDQEIKAFLSITNGENIVSGPWTSIRYTTVKEDNSYTVDNLSVSTTTQTFFTKKPLGSNLEWKSDSEKIEYLTTCLNSKGESILDRYEFKQASSISYN